MERGLENIEARIGGVEKFGEAADAREKRLFEATARFYAEQEKIEVAGLGSLFKKAEVGPANIKEFFKAQEGEARRRIEAVTPQLQLTEAELEFIRREERAVLLIDPCTIVHHSPGWECQHHAAFCNSTHWETADASGSCVCNTPNNECNPRVEARGQGSNGWRSAYVHCWCYFNIPARPATANVTVYVRVMVHGFYILRSATGSATFSLVLEAEGYQYGYSWNKVTLPVLNLSGDTMGRYDANEYFNFVMPVGADPFVVKVSAKLRATAKMGGALAVGDFATGAGNFIKTNWVNTYSPD